MQKDKEDLMLILKTHKEHGGDGMEELKKLKVMRKMAEVGEKVMQLMENEMDVREPAPLRRRL